MHCQLKKWRCCVWSSVFQLSFLIWMLDSSKGSSLPQCNYADWGLAYIGSANITQDGLTCQRWDSNWPHAILSKLTVANFPDGSKSEAQNFCRNPFPRDRENNSGDASPWCFTTNPNVLWQYCKPFGEESGREDHTAYSACVLERHGAGYSGHVAVTRSGLTCDLWSRHWNSTLVFPDGTAKKARNYCRNPTPNSRKGPWCFTTSDLVRWDYCDVCIPFRGRIVRRSGLLSKDRIKLPSMPIVNCLHWCIAHLSCVGIDFQRDLEECWYTPHTFLAISSDERFDHYSVERKCLEVLTGSLNSGQQADGSTKTLQTNLEFQPPRPIRRIGGNLKTAFEEIKNDVPHSNSYAQKLRMEGVDRSGQEAAEHEAEEVSVNGGAMRAGCDRSAGPCLSPGSVNGELQRDRTDRAEGVRGTASRPGRTLRHKRGQGHEIPDETRLSKRAQKRQAATVTPTKASAAQAQTEKSKLAGILACLMIAMTVIVIISTIYAFVKISLGEKPTDETPKIAEDASQSAAPAGASPNDLNKSVSTSMVPPQDRKP